MAKENNFNTGWLRNWEQRQKRAKENLIIAPEKKAEPIKHKGRTPHKVLLEEINKGNKSKYGVAKKEDRTFDGIVFDSKLEMLYYQRLLILKNSRKERERVVLIERQVPFAIDVEGKRICKYLLDFRVTYADKHIECIDVKGVSTALYKIKKKLVEAIYAIKIIEIKKTDFKH